MWNDININDDNYHTHIYFDNDEYSNHDDDDEEQQQDPREQAALEALRQNDDESSSSVDDWTNTHSWTNDSNSWTTINDTSSLRRGFGSKKKKKTKYANLTNQYEQRRNAWQGREYDTTSWDYDSRRCGYQSHHHRSHINYKQPHEEFLEWLPILDWTHETVWYAWMDATRRRALWHQVQEPLLELWNGPHQQSLFVKQVLLYFLSLDCPQESWHADTRTTLVEDGLSACLYMMMCETKEDTEIPTRIRRRLDDSLPSQYRLDEKHSCGRVHTMQDVGIASLMNILQGTKGTSLWNDAVQQDANLRQAVDKMAENNVLPLLSMAVERTVGTYQSTCWACRQAAHLRLDALARVVEVVGEEPKRAQSLCLGVPGGRDSGKLVQSLIFALDDQANNNDDDDDGTDSLLAVLAAVVNHSTALRQMQAVHGLEIVATTLVQCQDPVAALACLDILTQGVEMDECLGATLVAVDTGKESLGVWLLDLVASSGGYTGREHRALVAGAVRLLNHVWDHDVVMVVEDATALHESLTSLEALRGHHKKPIKELLQKVEVLQKEMETKRAKVWEDDNGPEMKIAKVENEEADKKKDNDVDQQLRVLFQALPSDKASQLESILRDNVVV